VFFPEKKDNFAAKDSERWASISEFRTHDLSVAQPEIIIFESIVWKKSTVLQEILRSESGVRSARAGYREEKLVMQTYGGVEV
jgi:hypothetical protein